MHEWQSDIVPCRKLREEQAAARSERESKHKQTTLDTFLRKSKPSVAKPKAGVKAAIVSKPLQQSVPSLSSSTVAMLVRRSLRLWMG